MNKINHVLFGGTAWALGATVLGHPDLGVAGAPFAMLTSGGPLSPDMDQYKKFKLALGWIGDIFDHRRLTHWWGLPAIAALFLYFSPIGTPWPFWALIVGWSSHIVGDWAFGRAVPRTNIPKGVPVWPWWGHVGAGFRSEGFAATVFVIGFIGLSAHYVLI